MRTHNLDSAVDSAVGAGAPLVIAGVTGPDATGYLHAAGDGAAPDTVIALYSATKAFTATAALQCVEDGLIDLDVPAKEYLPTIGELQVLTDLGDDGAVRTRPPVRDITPRMLLLHTSGLAYDMFDRRYAILARERMRHPSATPLRDSITTPLLHDPGERWTYGTSMDWMGLLIAEVRGKRLEDVFAERIYAPCGMRSTSFDVSPAMRERLATVYRRQRDGSIVPTKVSPPDVPELDMGGQGLFSTVPDLLALLRVWLGDGMGAHGRVLQAATVAWAVQGAPGVEVTPLPSAIPALTREADFFPGARKSWAYSFLRNDDDVPGGRRAGSLTWAGLANVFYWIDRSSGIAAVWATQLLPFFDPVAEQGVAAFEHAVYEGLGR
ncbi:serine hydrolase domain-containing protein [Microbacterium luticocti]|uniref:serine hydrolase domain-containing protein n=1 Tax=Microbacterium luticocti TaxID=451764 RepID=UPI00041E7086|nr:serine hydrolase domain-containing protein [Microbacterium luticocti]